VWQRFSATVGSGATAETVVCLHDAGSGSREFHPLISRIPIGSQLLMLDWPGHGHSADPVERADFSLERCSSLLSGVLHQLESASQFFWVAASERTWPSATQPTIQMK
jgi:pimeloyl-ACP methyl ester carboxylesterase